MQANILPFNTHTVPRRGQKVNTFLLYIKLKGKKCRAICKFDLMPTADLFGLDKSSDIEIVVINIF